ncbi:MAG TPA: hypothetical protein VFT32_00405 [Candidatus Eisenbacteria bacterium]|nr:hypothetical protein [Candidatus Eisenbacteria bacterium]
MTGHPSAIWSLAQIAARLGERDEAIARLMDYAAMGLARSPRRDSSFTALAGHPQFEAVAKRLEENAGAVADSASLRRVEPFAPLGDPALLAEDLARDPRTGIVYVSSIHRRKVIAVEPSGAVRDFVGPAQNGVWGIYALVLDTAGDRLWGSAAASPAHENFVPADSGRTAVLAWDLRTGVERVRVELPRDGTPHVLGDIALGADGTLYASDSVGGGLYALRPGAASFDTLAAPGTFGSPQGILEVEPEKRLLVADYPRGLILLDLERRHATPVRKSPNLALVGIDGLVRGERTAEFLKFFAVQNGIRPARVLSLRFHFEPSGVAGGILERLDSSLGETGHAVLDDGDLLLIGNSGWERVNEREELQTDDKSSSPFLFWIRPRYR